MEFFILKKLSTWHWNLLVTYSRRNIQGQSDRVFLEQAEARELYRNWESSKNRDLIRARLERAERIYGTGARDRIREYMNRIKDGTLE
jgi:hypothetical protein